MPDISSLHRFLHGEFAAEAQAGFPRARRIPDMRVRHFLDYHADLSAGEQDALADAVTLRGALGLAASTSSAHWDALNSLPAWQRWRHEAVTGVARDPHYYYSVPILRACVAQAHADLALGRPSSLPAADVAYAESIRGVKAPELRKRTRAALTALFGPGLTVANRSGSYDGALRGSRVLVGLDFGSRYRQLGYEVVVESVDPPGRLARAGFEMALGIGHGHWDFIVEENVDDAVALLCEFVDYVADLPRRLPAGSPADRRLAPLDRGRSQV